MKIVIIGSGNVASHLADGLDKVATILQIWSRDLTNATNLSSRLSSRPLAIDRLEDIDKEADFYIVSVADKAIGNVVGSIKRVKGLVLHTSGSVHLETLQKSLSSNKCGVLYPLQTFTKDTPVTLNEIPFLIEGTDDETLSKIEQLASLLTSHIYHVDSQTREKIHIAAVMANNFANHIWVLADRYLKNHTGFDITILEPLLRETLRKAMEITPEAAQTGPAVRGDNETIRLHISRLESMTAEIYDLLSRSIEQTANLSKKGLTN